MSNKPLKVKEVPRTEMQGEKSWWSQGSNLALVAVLSLLTVGAILLATRLLGPADVAGQQGRAEAPGAVNPPAPAGSTSCTTDPTALTGALPAPTSALPDGRPQWASPFPMLIDPNRDYSATLVTDKGTIVVDLFEKEAPNTVNNFVALAASGFYNGTTFHRVLEGFMAQGGDPMGTGRGGPGYTFADEFSPALSHSQPGTLSMANSGANSNGSQFFITFGPTPHLDAYENGQLKPCDTPNVSCHAVFGVVTQGMDVLSSLTRVDPQAPGGAPPSVLECVGISVR